MLGLFKRKQRVITLDRINLAHAQHMTRGVDAYVAEGYKKNVIIYRCVQTVAEYLASIPLYIRVGDEEKPNHPLARVLARPNPLQSRARLFESLVSWRLISGTGFLEVTTRDDAKPGGEPLELWPWPSKGMSVVVPRNTRIPEAYLYQHGDQRIAWPVDQVSLHSDLLAWASFNPDSLHLGLSSVEPCALSADQHNEASTWNLRMLQNSTVPPGVFSTEGDLTAEQLAELKEQVRANYQGAENARKALILFGGINWTQQGLTPVDMDWINGRNVSAQDICAAFGVPTQLLGLPGTQTFANYEQARASMWEDKILPLHSDLLDSLNNFLSYRYKDSPTICADIDEIAALAPRRAEKWAMVQSADFLTINEKREAVGYDRVDDPSADVLLTAGNMFPLSEITEKPIAPQESDSGVDSEDDEL